ncbi:MAG: S8 family serine peptidase [Myxococcota bacterium]
MILPIAPAAAPTFDDPEFGGQWYLDELGMVDLFERGLGDPSIRIGVIDSGIDVSHPDLAPAVLAPLDIVGDDDDPTPDDPTDDHGTAVSGIVAARANNGDGIVGMCPECTLVPVRLIGANELSGDVAAFEHMLEQNVAVVNNSWGFTEVITVPSALEEVIDRLARTGRDGKGTVVVFAAGNDSREIRPDELQAMERVLCVTALDRYGLPANFTNEGLSVDVAAPAATVSIAPNDGIITNFGGTSSAAPVVSGIAGWLLSLAPDLKAAEVRDLIRDTAYKTSQVTFQGGHHPVYGYGEIDPVALVAALDAEDAPDPVDEEEAPKGCGCDHTTSGFGLLGALALAGVARRRHGRGR